MADWILGPWGGDRGTEPHNFWGNGGRKGDMALMISARSMDFSDLGCYEGALPPDFGGREKRGTAPIFGHGSREGGNKPHYQNDSTYTTVPQKKDKILTDCFAMTF